MRAPSDSLTNILYNFVHSKHQYIVYIKNYYNNLWAKMLMTAGTGVAINLDHGIVVKNTKEGVVA